MRRLAKDDDIAVAGPVLHAVARGWTKPIWSSIAKTKSQAHLLAISGRAGIAEPVTDVLVRRGDRRGRAQRRRESDAPGCPRAASRRWSSAPRATACWPRRSAQRPDIPPQLFRDLLLHATAVVQQRLLASAKPETQAEIQRVLAKVSNEVGTDRRAPRDYTAAQRAVAALQQGRQAQRGQARRIRQGREIRGDGGRAGGAVRGADRGGGPPDGRRPAGSDPHPVQVRRLRLADRARHHHGAPERARARRARRSMPPIANFERLSAATAQRVMRFWQVAPAATSGSRRADMRLHVYFRLKIR